MKNQRLEKIIILKNRQTHDTEAVIDDKKQYDNIYKQLLQFNDIKQAIKVFCDLQNKTEKELLQDFNLVELVNCFSTRFMAITVKDTKVEKYSEAKNATSI